MAAAAGAVRDAGGAEASLLDALATALEANRQLAEMAAELREDNARLRERDAERDAELEKLRADFTVLQRVLFGRSSERSRPGPPGGGDGDVAGDGGRGSGTGKKRGPGARAGRRDYSHLPRVEVIWDFPGGGYCCPECGEPFTPLNALACTPDSERSKELAECWLESSTAFSTQLTRSQFSVKI